MKFRGHTIPMYLLRAILKCTKQSCNLSCPLLPSAELFGFLRPTRSSPPPSAGPALSPLAIYSTLTSSATSIISSAPCVRDLPTSPHNIPHRELGKKHFNFKTELRPR